MEKKRGQVQLNYWRTKFLNICIHSENDNLAKKKKKKNSEKDWRIFLEQ